MHLADVAAALDVSPAAQLDGEGILTDGQHADFLTILGIEECRCAARLGLIETHELDGGLGVGQDLRVDDALDLGQLLGRHRLKVAEVEAQTLGRDQRALLLNVLAQHQTQRFVQQVRGGVVAHGSRAQLGIDLRTHLVTDLESAFDQHTVVQVMAGLLLGIADLEAAAIQMQITGVTGLAA